MKLFGRKSKKGKNQPPLQPQPNVMPQDSSPPGFIHFPDTEQMMARPNNPSSNPRQSHRHPAPAASRQQQQQVSAMMTQPPPVAPPPPQHNKKESLITEDSSSDPEVTRELIRKFVADCWNRGDIKMISQVCSKSLRFNGSVGLDRVGHEGFASMVTTIREALQDYHCEIHSMVVEGNKAFCRFRFTGRHVGPLMGYPATGRQVSWMGATEFTIKKKLIVKVWELGDVKSLEEQLKGTPGAAGAAAHNPEEE